MLVGEKKDSGFKNRKLNTKKSDNSNRKQNSDKNHLQYHSKHMQPYCPLQNSTYIGIVAYDDRPTNPITNFCGGEGWDLGRHVVVVGVLIVQFCVIQ
jgi:hypothetical protein